MKSKETKGVPLPLAAMALRMSRDRTMRLILTGELTGWQGAGGRWFIDPASLESVRAALQEQAVASVSA